jgi:hypothetical protein
MGRTSHPFFFSSANYREYARKELSASNSFFKECARAGFLKSIEECSITSKWDDESYISGGNNG